jgi:hypothetical protein
MARTSYFANIKLAQSPLLQIKEELDRIIEATTNNSNVFLLSFANLLSDLNTTPAKTRASFIRLQIGGIDTEDLFEEHRESWGIPKFEENLLGIQDFKNGFLWRFRDHTTSWAEDVEAREWFYTHIEARFTRRYEFWSCDHGPEEMLTRESGDYKNILTSIINKHGNYTPFISPVFSHKELKTFYDAYNENDDGFYKGSLLEIMQQNVNW